MKPLRADDLRTLISNKLLTPSGATVPVDMIVAMALIEILDTLESIDQNFMRQGE